MDYLKTNDDPRVSVIAEIPKNGKTNNLDETLDGDRTYDKQVGMPNGYDQNGGATDITKASNYPGDLLRILPSAEMRLLLWDYIQDLQLQFMFAI